MLQTIKTAGKFTVLLAGVGLGSAQATPVFADSFEPSPCKFSQAKVNGTCVDLKISSIKPLAVANNQLTKFTLTGESIPQDLTVHVEECTGGKIIQRSDSMIQYQCKTTVAGEKSFVLAQEDKLVFSQKILVSGSSNQNISLPVAPSNPNQTVIGQDSNNNGVRDEVEIALANYANSADLYNKALVSAKAYQKVLTKPTPANRKQALELMSEVTCQLSKGLRVKSLDKDIYIPLTFNTEARKAKYSAFLESLDGGYMGFELKPCNTVTAKSLKLSKRAMRMPAIKGTGTYFDPHNKQVIKFVPGIMNSWDDAAVSSQALAQALGLDPNNAKYTYDFFHNPSEWVVNDTVELQYQAMISNEALKRAGLSTPHNMTREKKRKYYHELGKMYADPTKMPNLGWHQTLKEQAKKRIIKTTNKLASTIEKFLTDWSFETLVLVPHSQGNFYVEAAYALLYYQKKEDILNRVRVFGVAPVAASTPNNTYMLSIMDATVRGLQSANVAIFTRENDVYDHLKYNTAAAFARECGFFDIHVRKGKCHLSIGGHSFTDIYLNKFITNRKSITEQGKRYPQIVKDNVLGYMDKLKHLHIDNKATVSFANSNVWVGVPNDLRVKLNFSRTINHSDNVIAVVATIEGTDYQLTYNSSEKTWVLKDVVFDKLQNNIKLSIKYVTQENVIVPLVITKKLTIPAVQLTIDAPGNFEARLVGKNSAALSWDVVNDSNVTGYQISKKKSGESQFTVIRTITDVATKVTAVTKLDYNTQYTFQIIALGKNNAKSDPVTATLTVPQLTIASPTNFTVRLVGQNSAVLSWDEVNDSNVTGYEISHKKAGDANYTVVKTVSGSPTVRTPLADNQLHYFQVRAVAGTVKSTPQTAPLFVPAVYRDINITVPVNNSTLPAHKAITVKGTAPANTEISVALNNKVTCTATTDSGGNWSCEVPSGYVAASASLTFTASASGLANKTITVNTGIIHNEKIELIFMLDDSGSLSTADFQLQQQGFINAYQKMVQDYGSDLTNVSVVYFGSSGIVAANRLAASDSSNIVAALDKSFANGGTNLSDGLNKVEGILNAIGSGGAKPVIILSTDGEPDNRSSARTIANRLVKNSATDTTFHISEPGLLSIGISGADLNFLDSISENNVIEAVTIDEFSQTVVELIFGKVSAVLNEVKITAFNVDTTSSTGLDFMATCKVIDNALANGETFAIEVAVRTSSGAAVSINFSRVLIDSNGSPLIAKIPFSLTNDDIYQATCSVHPLTVANPKVIDTKTVDFMIGKIKLNDTGITRCGTVDDTSNSASCSMAVRNATGSQVPTGQDGQYGRKHMSFSIISGGDCVEDNHTGLIWEVKQGGDGTLGNEGLHDADDTYNWYSDNNNGGFAGHKDDDGATCYGYNSSNESTFCNTQAYVERVNAQGWCGAHDWRLPTMEELRSIVDYSRFAPAINTDYFPKTKKDPYWSSLSNVDNEHAWRVDFLEGMELRWLKKESYHLRLVRDK